MENAKHPVNQLAKHHALLAIKNAKTKKIDKAVAFHKPFLFLKEKYGKFAQVLFK